MFSQVNAQAEKVGAGTGTYEKDGVPGTFLDKKNPTHGYFGHGYGHGHAAYAPAY